MWPRITIAICFFLVSFLTVSCKKEEAGGSLPDVIIPAGVPTPVGTNIDEPTARKTIGAEGGTLSSFDGRIHITVPAGAVSSAQEFSIHPISNYNPLAIGNAYRLEPHGVNFSKPVQIEFSYNEGDVANTIPEALGAAYQDSNNVWQAMGGAVLNKAGRKLKINTTHFSDWSLFESFYLISSGTVVPVGGSIPLEVFTTEDLLIPLTEGEKVPMGKKVSMAAKYIKEWKLSGAGDLQSDESNAVYTAPSSVPGSPNPVAVSVSIDLQKRGTYLLVRHIEVVSDDGEIEIKVAGGEWVKKTASVAVKTDDGHYLIADSDGDTQGSYVLIMVSAELGTHAYRSPDENTGTYVHYLVGNLFNYTCMYMINDDELVPSGGGVTLTSVGEDDGFLKGTFKITPAGYGDFLRNTINIEGRFRVRIAPQQ